MRKLYYFFVNLGKIIFIWSIMFVISISAQSFTRKGQVDYGGRCYQNFSDEVIKKYSYNGIVLTSGKLQCNTYYLEYTTNLEKEKNIIFLSSLAKLLYDNNIDCNIHVILNGNGYQMLSTIIDNYVSYNISEI